MLIFLSEGKMDDLTVPPSALHEHDYIRTAIVPEASRSSDGSRKLVVADFPHEKTADFLPKEEVDFLPLEVKTEAEEAVWYNLRKLGKESMCKNLKLLSDFRSEGFFE
jgi:hypothetical protein